MVQLQSKRTLIFRRVAEGEGEQTFTVHPTGVAQTINAPDWVRKDPHFINAIKDGSLVEVKLKSVPNAAKSAPPAPAASGLS